MSKVLGEGSFPATVAEAVNIHRNDEYFPSDMR